MHGCVATQVVVGFVTGGGGWVRVMLCTYQDRNALAKALQFLCARYMSSTNTYRVICQQPTASSPNLSHPWQLKSSHASREQHIPRPNTFHVQQTHSVNAKTCPLSSGIRSVNASCSLPSSQIHQTSQPPLRTTASDKYPPASDIPTFHCGPATRSNQPSKTKKDAVWG